MHFAKVDNDHDDDDDDSGAVQSKAYNCEIVFAFCKSWTTTIMMIAIRDNVNIHQNEDDNDDWDNSKKYQ